MKTIKDIDLSAKRVLFRVDFNVPLDDKGHISDDSRITAALPTLRYAMEQGAKLIIASHLGRPKGKVVPACSLSPVASALSALLDTSVTMAPDCIGDVVTGLVSAMQPGEVILLENLRFHAQEEQNDDRFGKALAGLCDVYVNDAFAVCHRHNASVVSVTNHAPSAVAGFLLQKELDYFQQAMTDPARPLVAVIGGAKVSSKLDALENMLQHVDKILIGGAMANTFLASMGYQLGKSKIEADLIEAAGAVYRNALNRGIRFYLPVDAVVADGLAPDARHKQVPVQEIPPEWMAADIGPATALLYAQALKDAGTIVWNGPMGIFEMEAFSKGTFALARAVAESQALTIVGGGDTGSALHQSGEAGKVTYISTGGGAFLTLMEGKTLPAVAALIAAQSR